MPVASLAAVRKLGPSRLLAARALTGLAVVAVSAAYLGWDLPSREVTLLESQDLGIAHALFASFGLSPDHSPLHFVFLHFWESLDTTSVAFLRAPSVVFAAMAVLVVARWAEAIGGRLAGATAAVLFGTNPAVTDAARSMRLYALGLLLAALSFSSAHAFLRTRERSAFVRFAVASVLAVYNHLFAWLLVGPLALWIGVDIFRNEQRRDERRWLRKWSIVGAVLLVPQVVHVVVALGYTSERHSLYEGLPSGPASFLLPIGRVLFLGEGEGGVPVGNAVLLVPLALVALGAVPLWKRAPGLLLVFGSALGVSWILSFSNPVEPRYLNFLTPAIAVAMGMGATRRYARCSPAANVALAGPVLALALHATHAANAGPPTDWYSAAARLAAMKQPDDVVAVFPDFWEPTFRRYGRGALGEIATVAFPTDLDRILARRKRVLLVAYPGREFASIAAMIKENATSRHLFTTEVRDAWEVYALTPKLSPPPGDSLGRASIVLAGVVGSGGYPWQGTTGARPLHHLASLLDGSGAVVVGYEAYHPPWYARALLGGRLSRLFEPNLEVDDALAHAGVSAVVRSCPAADRCGADRLENDGLDVIGAMDDTDGGSFRPRRFEIGGAAVGVFSLRSDVIDESAVRRAKESLGPQGRLVALTQVTPDYGRVATAAERRAARRLVDLGVDVVVGMGGYAAKEIETYHGGIIAYSLGTLLRPPTMCLATTDSSGIALRLGFPADGSTTFDVVPLTFDDEVQAEVGRAATTQRLVRDSDAGDSLSDRLDGAVAGYSDPGVAAGSLGAWRDGPQTIGTGFEKWYLPRVSSLTAWFPLTVRATPLRPLDGAFMDGSSYVARRAALSLGAYRRVVEIDPGGHASVWVRVDGLPPARLIEIAYGLPDDRLRSKVSPLHEQRIHAWIGEREILAETLPYRVGWTEVVLDGRSLPPGPIKLQVDGNGTHFPVAFDVRVRR
jgi:hypothetical protein